jgi:hypothetical protein
MAPVLRARLRESACVALLGPRQVGKTTMALDVAGLESAGRSSGDAGAAGEPPPPLYLDLESERDRALLVEPEAFLASRLDRLVILDEIHRVPGLFPVIRGLVDRARRQGRRQGLFLLLGSAGLDVLKQSGESLAGRVSFLELSPLSVLETDGTAAESLWLRGGFPDSLLTQSDAASLRWRVDFIRTYLERDVAQFAPRMPAESLRRFWTMLAHRHGGLLSLADLARSLDVTGKTVGRYIDLLVDLLLVRRLPAWHANVGKRLVKSPKVYLRDSGLVHALLGIADEESLLSHPVVGASWEGHVLESLLTAIATSERPDVQPYFYRTVGGAEIDLLLRWPDGDTWAIEIKRSMRPKPDRGFHEACADLDPSRRFVVFDGRERVPVGSGVEGIPLRDLALEVRARAGVPRA